jgi:hypothetical protein
MSLLVVADIWVALASIGSSSEAVSWWKLFIALIFQAIAVALLIFFVADRRPTRNAAPGPWEAFREWVTPYFLFLFAVAFSLSLLYNAVACGEQSFVKSRKGEPICNK